MASTTEQRRAYVNKRAYELAQTGNYKDYLGIENALIQEGYPEARDWLDRDSIRDDLKAICDNARGSKDANRT